MKTYILAIIGVVLLSAVVTIIAPGGKMGRFLKGATKLAILFVMLLPLRAVLSGDAISVSSGNMALDESYLEHCAKALSAEDAASIVLHLEERYGVTAAVKVERNADATFSYEKIVVHISDFGISDADEHIYMIEKIEAALETYFGCDAEVS